jgi:hypothetical protein
VGNHSDEDVVVKYNGKNVLVLKLGIVETEGSKSEKPKKNATK